MKKIISLILVLVLVLGLAVTANAADATGDVTFDNRVDPYKSGPDWTNDNTVKVNVAVTATDPVYYVAVVWEDLTFTYTFDTGNSQWDPINHKYEEVDDQNGWDKESAKVTVTNHSNKKVKVSAAIADVNPIAGVTAGVTGGATLPSAEGMATNAPELTTAFTVSVSGTPESNNAITNQEISKVTVTIEKV